MGAVHAPSEIESFVIVIAEHSWMQSSKRWLVAEPFKTGGSKGFEVVGIISTINPPLQNLLHKIVEAGCAPSEHNAIVVLSKALTPSEANISINLEESSWIVAEATCLAPVEKNLTINWSEYLACVTIIIAEHLNWGSKRLDIIIAGSFQRKISKRYLGVA